MNNSSFSLSPYCPVSKPGLAPFCSEYGWSCGLVSSFGSATLTWSGSGLRGPILPVGSCGNIICTLIPNTPGEGRGGKEREKVLKCHPLILFWGISHQLKPRPKPHPLPTLSEVYVSDGTINILSCWIPSMYHKTVSKLHTLSPLTTQFTRDYNSAAFSTGFHYES